MPSSRLSLEEIERRQINQQTNSRPVVERHTRPATIMRRIINSNCLQDKTTNKQHYLPPGDYSRRRKVAVLRTFVLRQDGEGANHDSIASWLCVQLTTRSCHQSFVRGNHSASSCKRCEQNRNMRLVSVQIRQCGGQAEMDEMFSLTGAVPLLLERLI